MFDTDTSTSTPAMVDEARASLPARVDAIRVRGLTRTRADVPHRELGFSEGDVVSRARLAAAITRLWNTNLFAHVDGAIVRDGARNVARFDLDDRWTVIPLFSFAASSDAGYIRLGVEEKNLLGRFVEVSGMYEYFAGGYSGGRVGFRDPRLAGRRVELTAQVEQLIRPRPGYSDQRALAMVELAALASSDRVRFGLRTSGFVDRFIAPPRAPVYYPAPTETLLFEPLLRVGRVDTVRLRQQGVSLEVRPGVGLTTSDVASKYLSLTHELLAFAAPGSRWNLAARVRFSAVSDVPEHLQLYAGGLDLVRGFPDNYFRGRALGFGNFEARFIAFDSTWFAAMPAVFADVAAATAPASNTGTAASVGAGVRLLIPKFVGSGLRIDVAVPVWAGYERDVHTGPMGPPVPHATLGQLSPSFGASQLF